MPIHIGQLSIETVILIQTSNGVVVVIQTIQNEVDSLVFARAAMPIHIGQLSIETVILIQTSTGVVVVIQTIQNEGEA
ncbi:hypothetical protein KIN20_012388 [Parelaphostrongylus tenuis]|uniref:Uncharacterized protein n=1 Tax=Parelaphostrongylus tenuis TaxID=148309 RepID=A0AAD5MC35_PARTN|nr:hypothetical protein KIN20_012388 [Parelaphostrongylus tenuis]